VNLCRLLVGSVLQGGITCAQVARGPRSDKRPPTSDAVSAAESEAGMPATARRCSELSPPTMHRETAAAQSANIMCVTSRSRQAEMENGTAWIRTEEPEARSNVKADQIQHRRKGTREKTARRTGCGGRVFV
jgi:hypothetical protein